MNNETENKLAGNEPFLLVTDQNTARSEVRGYEQFLLGPVEAIDGKSAESNAKYLEMIVSTIGDYHVSIVLAKEIPVNHADIKQVRCMTPEEVDASFAVLAPSMRRGLRTFLGAGWAARIAPR